MNDDLTGLQRCSDGVQGECPRCGFLTQVYTFPRQVRNALVKHMKKDHL